MSSSQEVARVSFGLEAQVALADAHTTGGTREIRAMYDERTVRVYQA